MELDIENIVKQIKRGKPEALKKLMDLYMGAVYGVAKNILYEVATIEDIEECTIDVFTDAWNNIHKYDECRGSIKTWLLILCKYKALNIKKTINKRNMVISLEEIQIKNSEDIEESYIIKERKEEIIEVINSFNNIDKTIFHKRYFGEQSVEEICAYMNMSRQAVDNRLWRGRKKIKEIINSRERRDVNE